jgi:hypothetical protein
MTRTPVKAVVDQGGISVLFDQPNSGPNSRALALPAFQRCADRHRAGHEMPERWYRWPTTLPSTAPRFWSWRQRYCCSVLRASVALPLRVRRAVSHDRGVGKARPALCEGLPAHRWRRRPVFDQHPLQLPEIAVTEKPANRVRWDVAALTESSWCLDANSSSLSALPSAA